jgi:hypothetical protein
VKKTTNSGFTWGTSKATELVAGDVSNIAVISEDNVVVGSTQGYVSYSTDGNSSWTKISKQVDSSGATQVTASGLAADEYIYAATSKAGASIKRWKVGQSMTVPWKDLADPNDSTHGVYGIALYDGALYAATSNGSESDVLRTLLPTISEPSSVHWSNMDGGTKVFTNTPSEMRVSTGSTKLWLCSGATLYHYTDTLATSGPTLIGPADGRQIKLNPISGIVYDVSFTWERLSKAKEYDLWIAYDSAFKEKAITVNIPSTTSSTPAYIVGPSGTAGTNKLDLMPGVTYYWKVRVDKAGPVQSKWSEVRSFDVEPGGAVVPIIGTPENGATDVKESPAFSWAPVSGATMYQFQLGSAPNFAAPLVDQELAESGIAPLVKLDPGVTYFWRVRALEPIEGNWSTIANFTVAVPAEEPPPPVVIEQAPPPQITIPPIEVPPAIVNIPESPPPAPPVNEGLLLAIIIIGAVLVIALIVLIIRTRRTV